MPLDPNLCIICHLPLGPDHDDEYCQHEERWRDEAQQLRDEEE